jgi:hypothetical protein
MIPRGKARQLGGLFLYDRARVEIELDLVHIIEHDRLRIEVAIGIGHIELIIQRVLVKVLSLVIIQLFKFAATASSHGFQSLQPCEVVFDLHGVVLFLS